MHNFESRLELIFLENLEKKRPHILKQLEAANKRYPGHLHGWPDDLNQVVAWLGQADPVSYADGNAARFGRKTPFVNLILKWFLNGSVRFPEDIVKVRDLLTRYQLLKHNSPAGAQLDAENMSIGDLYAAVRKLAGDEGTATSYDEMGEKAPEAVELVGKEGAFSCYMVNQWLCSDDSRRHDVFAGTNWCVQHQDAFDEYQPPFYLFTANNSRYALMHIPSRQLKDVNDELLAREANDTKALEPIIGLIKQIMPEEAFTQSVLAAWKKREGMSDFGALMPFYHDWEKLAEQVIDTRGRIDGHKLAHWIRYVGPPPAHISQAMFKAQWPVPTKFDNGIEWLLSTAQAGYWPALTERFLEGLTTTDPANWYQIALAAVRYCAYSPIGETLRDPLGLEDGDNAGNMAGYRNPWPTFERIIYQRYMDIPGTPDEAEWTEAITAVLKSYVLNSVEVSRRQFRVYFEETRHLVEELLDGDPNLRGMRISTFGQHMYDLYGSLVN